MSLISPKTIVITAYPGKQNSVTMPTADISVLDPVDPFDSGGPKKRRRLTHLTQDEKLLRRKLKNRVAAQTARDRKKALMTDLEEKVALLEEENKLLRKQNDTLRETSQNLVDENKALRSRLSGKPVPEVGSESEASRSAAPAIPLQKEQAQILSQLLVQYFTFVHDNVINLYQRVSNLSSNSSSQAKTTTSSTQSLTQLSTSSTSRDHTPGVVGLSSAELESLNELIHIDHVYFKPQPSVQFKEVVETSENIARKVNNSEPTITQQYTPKELTVPIRSKRDSRGNLISSEPISTVVVDPSQCIANPVSASHDDKNADNEFVDSFSYSDIDSSLDLFQSLEFGNLFNGCDVMDSCTTDEIKSSSSTPSLSPQLDKNISVLNSNLSTQISPSTNISQCELDSQKLFNEICDSYLSYKNSSSPDQGNFSDSGFGSDVGEAFSPQYSEGSLLDEYPWQDSFTELFPDLQ